MNGLHFLFGALQRVELETWRQDLCCVYALGIFIHAQKQVVANLLAQFSSFKSRCSYSSVVHHGFTDQVPESESKVRLK